MSIRTHNIPIRIHINITIRIYLIYLSNVDSTSVTTRKNYFNI